MVYSYSIFDESKNKIIFKCFTGKFEEIENDKFIDYT